MKELDRLQVMTRIAERRLTRRRAAELLRLSERHVRRLYDAFAADGASSLASRRRGRPSARRLADATREHALALIRERYADFGPTFVLCVDMTLPEAPYSPAGAVLWARFKEQADDAHTFSIQRQTTGRFGHEFTAGSANVLQSRDATLHLADATVQGSGPTGQDVTLRIPVSFKPRAAGRNYEVEATATTDDGDVPGFEHAGTLRVE